MDSCIGRRVISVNDSTEVGAQNCSRMRGVGGSYQEGEEEQQR
ncbi:MAG: hypothetical protein P8Y08_14475 [Desulfobulbaceae bacterium]